uniref:EGF-like domain-containing protein n=1 Tax=Erpetoichthys calabaricus TaxID=27687 RepID=A0A8C4TCC3_ERPCA
ERWKCNGYKDCADNSDELERVCAFHTCLPMDFTCDNGRCVPYAFRCDHFNDCGDYSDEVGCAFPTCNPSTEFTCSNGRCISQQFVCDGINHCLDSQTSDEINCPNRTCPAGTFTCPLPWYSGPRCIPKSYVCDGERDCSNAADELQNCTTRQCHANEFRCTNGLCIPLHFSTVFFLHFLSPHRCDRRNDCGDGSDEKGCTYPSCSASQFTCQNGMCIPSAFVCDGDNDCWDNSDELDSLCRTPVPTCAPGQFQCSSGECIDLHKVCNGQNDCNDMSDERRCGVDECADVAVSQCAQNCTNTLTSYFCSCWPGYRLMPDGKACEDIDECFETPAVCSQICENSVGSFHCKCASGYIREPDGHTCRHNSPVQPYLLFSNGYYIRNLTTDGGSLSIVLQGLTNGVALDFDHYEQRLYWIDVGEGKIERMFFNGTGRETIIDHNVPLPEGLAIDWVGRKMYWTDATIGAIHVSELDGRFRRKLISNCVGHLNGWHPSSSLVPFSCVFRWLYWTDWGQKAFIGRAGMDGQDRSAIITTKIEWPYDAPSSVCGNRHIAISGGIPYCYALTLFEDMVYWTDWNTKTVETAHKYTGAGRLSMMNITHKPNDIHVYHPYRQPRGKASRLLLLESVACVLWVEPSPRRRGHSDITAAGSSLCLQIGSLVLWSSLPRVDLLVCWITYWEFLGSFFMLSVCILLSFFCFLLLFIFKDFDWVLLPLAGGFNGVATRGRSSRSTPTQTDTSLDTRHTFIMVGKHFSFIPLSSPQSFLFFFFSSSFCLDSSSGKHRPLPPLPQPETQWQMKSGEAGFKTN